MAAEEDDRKESETGPVERQVSSLLEYLQTPIKQMQEWVSGGQLQSTIEHLQEQAERAQEGVERRLRALSEVRQGLEIHVRKQLEAYRREKDELAQRAETATAGEAVPGETALTETAPAEMPSTEAQRNPTNRPKSRPAQKKSGAKRATGRKE